MTTYNICIFGDSIVWGAGDYEKGGWVERLKVYFSEKYDIEVYNLGVAGDTSEDLLARLENESKARKANIIVFAIGLNDTQFIHSTNNNRVSEEDFQGNLKKIYQIAKRITNKIIFIGLTPVDESKTKPIPWDTDKIYTNERIKKFNQIIEDFCLKNNLKFIPINDLLSKDDLIDGLHPNNQGHRKIFERVKPEIEFFLKKED